MKSTGAVVLLIALTATAASAQRRDRTRDRDRTPSASAASHSDTGDFSQDYSILADVNIFQKDRHSRRPSNNTAPVLTPEQTFVLTGIVQDENERHAIFENLARNGIQKVAVGGSLARGTIAEIDDGQVAYEASGKRVWVQIGSNLTGMNAGVTDSSSGGNSGPAVDPNAPGLTLEQRMRARRAQQLNGGSSPGSQPPPNTSGQNGPANFQAQPSLQAQPNPQGPQAGAPSPGGFSGGSGGSTIAPRSAAVDANGNVTMTPTPQGNAAADPTEPVINHNFPQLPGDNPQPPPPQIND